MFSIAVAGPGERLLDPEYWSALDPQRLEALLDEVGSLDFSDEEGRTPLHAAAQGAAPETFALLLEHLRAAGPFDLEARDGEGNTPLLLAAAYNAHPGVCTLLVEAGADPDAATEDTEETALHLAARLNPELRVLEELLPLSRSLEVRDVDGWTPLLSAARSGRADKISLLLEAGADPSATDTDGAGALHLAAEVAPDDEPVRALLAAGFDPNRQDNDGWTPLHVAAGFNTGEGAAAAVRALLEAGARKDATTAIGETPLHVVARLAGRAEVLELLLEQGADPNARDEDGWTPLHGAAVGSTAAQIRTLIQAGAEVDARDHQALTPLVLLASWLEELDDSARDRARALIENGAEVTAHDRRGWTALHYAAAGIDTDSSEDALAFWIDLGIPVMARSYSGETPLHVAAHLNPDTEAIRTLAQGSDLEAADGDGWTPFLAAAAAGYVDNVKVLAELGADVHARSKLGRNAMHLAALFNEDEETLTALLDLGVDPVQQDVAGAYPWNLLLKNPELSESDLVVGLYPIGLHPADR